MGIDGIGIPDAIRTREDTEKADDELPGAISPLSLRDQETEQSIKDRKSDRKLRKTYSRKAFIFAWTGFWFWVAVSVFYVVCFLYSGKRIFSDAVLIAITSATTVNLFAAFIGVIRGLFPTIGKYDKPAP